MAGRNRQNKGISREEFSAVQQTRLEQAARKVPQTYSEDFGSKNDLHPARYPNAISHDSAFHDQLFTHIGNLETRVDNLVRAGSAPVKAIAGEMQGHLDKARDEANLSWAAHKAGTEAGVAGVHTAVQAYKRAHEHLSNAHKVAVNNLGIRSSQLEKIGGASTEHPLLTTTQREGLVEGYTQHVRDSASKAKINLPAGVAEPTKVKLSDMGDVSEVVRPGVYQQRKMSAKPQLSEKEIAVKKARKVVSEGLTKLQTTSSSGTLTREQVEGARRAASEGVAINPYRLPTTVAQPAYAGVGVTGFNDVANAAKEHFEYHNPGKKWSGSKESKDPVAYATKHRVGLPDQVSAIGKVQRLMGLAETRRGDVDSMAPKLVTNTAEEKPKKPVGRGKLISEVYGKESRNSAFLNGGNK